MEFLLQGQAGGLGVTPLHPLKLQGGYFPLDPENISNLQKGEPFTNHQFLGFQHVDCRGWGSKH